MGSPVRVAFCPIYFGANGGKFDARGQPVWREEDKRDKEDGDGGYSDGFPPLGKCDHPWDCGTCPYLHQYVTALMRQGWDIGWECDQCLKDTKKSDEEAGVQRALPGFYNTGKPKLPPEDPEHDPTAGALTGCTRCSWASSFLQLVLRKEPHGG